MKKLSLKRQRVAKLAKAYVGSNRPLGGDLYVAIHAALYKVFPGVQSPKNFDAFLEEGIRAACKAVRRQVKPRTA